MFITILYSVDWKQVTDPTWTQVEGVIQRWRHLKAGTMRTMLGSVHTSSCGLDGRCGVLCDANLDKRREIGRHKWWIGHYCLLVVFIRSVTDRCRGAQPVLGGLCPVPLPNGWPIAAPGHHQRLTETYRGNSCTKVNSCLSLSLHSPSCLAVWVSEIDRLTTPTPPYIQPSFPSFSQLCEVNSRRNPFRNTQGTVCLFPNPVRYR